MPRQQSPETKLRHAKRELSQARSTIAALMTELRHRRLVGQLMSNVCFNLSQSEAQDPRNRQSMKECQQQWDKIPTLWEGR